MKKFLLKSLLVAVGLLTGGSAWATDVPYTVGTEGTGDAWASRKYSDAYEIAPGEIYHFTFTNTSYGSNNWNNWLLDCKATADTSVDDWYFTMRSDNHGWGTSYNATMRYTDFVWNDFKTTMNGATVDMYVDYNSTDKIIRTYATITKSETTWHYNFASKAIDQSSVFLFLSEELAVLDVTAAEKVASLPDGTYGIYKRSITNGYSYTWDTNTEGADYTGWSNSGGTKTLDLTDGMKLSLGNAGGTMSTSISPTIGDIINVDATFFLKGSTGGDNDYTNYSYFRFGNIYITNTAQQCDSKYSLNGPLSSDNQGTVFHSTTAGSSSIYRTTGISYHLQLELNTTTNKVTSLKVYVNGAVDPSLNISEQTLTSYNYSTIELGYSKTKTSSSSIESLKEIIITETPQTISTVDYTVKFQDALGNTLKDDVVHDNGVVGEVYQATSADMETFYNNADESLATKKYIFKSGQNTSLEASATASENVITLVFDVYDKTTYHVNAQAGGSDIKIDMLSGSAYLDGSTTVYWSKYLKVSDQWYVADETTFGTAITTATTNIAYTATDAINYFFEYEDMSDNDAILDASSGTAISGGASKRFNKYGKKWTTVLTGGAYTIDMYCYGHNGKSTTISIYYCDANGANEVYIGESTACQASSWALKTTTNVVIPDGKALCFYNNTNSTHNYIVDYVTLKRTSDATVSATITSAEWATLYSPYALDFSDVDGLTAYTAAVSENTVYLTEVNDVPANTGVVLHGAEGNYNIPVIASSSTAQGELTGNASATTAFDAFSGYTLYVLRLINGGRTVQFNNVTSGSIDAGKAFLKIANTPSGSAPSLKVAFTDEMTGIDEVNAPEAAVNGCFNLAGQRVANPTKGLYIVNGKKVLVK